MARDTSKLVTIPGELHSAATGSIVAAAEEIFDYTANKYQKDINQEVASSIQDLRSTVGYYICSTAGNTAEKAIDASGYTLLKGGGLRVKFTEKNTAANATLNIENTGANPLYYNGVRVSTNNSWYAGEIMTLFYDGAAFQLNSLPDLDEYDVSAKNGSQAFTFSEAVALVPEAYRHGGLKLKFISNSDSSISGNKYVQYRYMGTETTGNPNPFLDEVNWQNDDIMTHIDSIRHEMGNYVDVADSSLQGQINDIVVSQALISLSGSPSVIYAAKSDQTVLLSSNISTIGTISSHKILKGSTEISSGTDQILNGSDSSTNAISDITYTTEAVINGVKVSKESTVYVRYPIYFGAAATWDVINSDSHKASARTNPIGTYHITVSNDGQSVFFNVPSEMSITRATVSGFDMPFKPYVSKTIDGKEYKSYESTNTYTIGTLDVVIVS